MRDELWVRCGFKLFKIQCEDFWVVKGKKYVLTVVPGRIIRMVAGCICFHEKNGLNCKVFHFCVCEYLSEIKFFLIRNSTMRRFIRGESYKKLIQDTIVNTTSHPKSHKN